MRGRRALLAGMTIATLAASAAPAHADHHFMMIREFNPGTAAVANDAFLELQMYASGQQFVNGHDIHVYPPGSGGAGVFTFNPTTPILTNGGSQRTVLARGSSGPAGDFTENLDGAGSP